MFDPLQVRLANEAIGLGRLDVEVDELKVQLKGASLFILVLLESQFIKSQCELCFSEQSFILGFLVFVGHVRLDLLISGSFGLQFLFVEAIFDQGRIEFDQEVSFFDSLTIRDDGENLCSGTLAAKVLNLTAQFSRFLALEAPVLRDLDRKIGPFDRVKDQRGVCGCFVESEGPSCNEDKDGRCGAQQDDDQFSCSTSCGLRGGATVDRRVSNVFRQCRGHHYLVC
ncbi:MAG: hypothetical protein VX877_05325 [Planctomycetota bacterium]|nr:hypothetical protein [Planctomycetota bacterium]